MSQRIHKIGISARFQKGFRTGHLELMGVIAVIFIPAMAAWLVYMNPTWIPTKQSNFGAIISPVRPLPDLSLISLGDNAPLPLTDLRGKWTLLSIAHATCGQACRANIHKMRQVRLALGKDMTRLKRLLIMDDFSTGGFFKPSSEYAGTTYATGSKDTIDRLMALLEPEGSTAIDHLYIIDPLGNLMMHYLPNADGVGVVKDMERLLKVSQIG